ncbi:MAG: hypothetical protein AB4426_04995 [Xenococcaceae cyanobacterium]
MFYFARILSIPYIKVVSDPSSMPVIEVTGSNFKLSWCPIEQALGYLRDQYAIGSITAKIIQPAPEGL